MMRNGNRGSAVIEACVVIPLFLFLMLFVIYLYRMIYVDAHIHQSLSEAAIYCAQRCYLEDKMLSDKDYETTVDTMVNAGIVNAQFKRYLGDEALIKQVVAGGRKGIVITVFPDEADRKVFVAKAYYISHISIPLLGNYTIPRELSIKQKAFLGYDKSDEVNDEDTYVYVTPNEAVYHTNRSCSHLLRDVREVPGTGGYEPCSFCAKGKKDGNNGKKYVTDNGKAYHNDIHCLGLKRTVTRVKKSSVPSLTQCSRCKRR